VQSAKYLEESMKRNSVASRAAIATVLSLPRLGGFEMNLNISTVNLLGAANTGWNAVRREIVRQLKAAKVHPYCCVYSLSAVYVPPADFKAKAYLGLFSWHAVRNAAGTQIISYWQDEGSFSYHRLQFESDLKIAGTPFGGTVGDLHARESTLWPSSLKEVILAAAAILGALTVIWTTILPIGEAILTTPDAEVTFADPVIKIAERESRSVALTARNRTVFVPVQLAVSAKLTDSQSSTAYDVPIEPAVFQTVEPDSPKPLTARLTGRDLPSRHSPSANYTLVVSESVRTWRFQTPRPGRTETVPVKLFPREFGWDPKLHRIAQGGSVCNMTGRLSAGMAYPGGLRGVITLMVPASSDFTVSVLPPFRIMQQWPASMPVDGSKTVSVDISSPPLEKYQEMTFQVTVAPKSGQAPSDSCDATEKSASVNFPDGQ
jgi:hypothetical protein